MNMKPIGDKVVIKPMEKKEEAVTNTGIILPDTIKEKSYQGEVVAVGTGVLLQNGERAALQVAVGDKVVYNKFHKGVEVKFDGEEFLIVAEEDVLVVLG